MYDEFWNLKSKQNNKKKKVVHTVPTKTRCVIHNGPAINLISTIDIYDKLVLAKGKKQNGKKMYTML